MRLTCERGIKRMRPATFASPTQPFFRGRRSLLYKRLCIGKHIFSRASTLNDHDLGVRKSSSSSQQRQVADVIPEYLRELQGYRNTYRDTDILLPTTFHPLKQLSSFLRTHEKKLSLPVEPAIANLSVTGDYYLQATRILSKLPEETPQENVEGTHRFVKQPSRVGPAKRRNAFYLGIPYNYLRAHEAFHALPTSLNVDIDSYESLTSLRQDSQPFLAAWQVLPLHSDEIWPLLGLGEENPMSELLPRAYRGRKQVLQVWKKLSSADLAQSGKPRSFRQRFAHERVANAVFLYMNAERDRWSQLVPSAPPWCEAVQLLETGCWVYNEASIPLAAAPVARVARRHEEDYWMWGSVDTILISKTEDIFGSPSGGECRFEPLKVRNKMDMLSWIEAQFAMLCSGQHIRFADVAWYGTLGGFSVFRIRRDERFIQTSLKMLETFAVHFLAQGYPPPAGFEQGEGFLSLTESIFEGLSAVHRLAHIPATDAEANLFKWRRQMNEWESKRSQKPFF